MTRLFIRALMALREAGHAELACRLAAEGWSATRHRSPRIAERLNGALHALTRERRDHANSGDLSQ